MRYKMTHFTIEQVNWISAFERRSIEHAKTKGDLDVLVECALEDGTIIRAFYEDTASGKIVHIKANYKPLPFTDAP